MDIDAITLNGTPTPELERFIDRGKQIVAETNAMIDEATDPQLRSELEDSVRGDEADLVKLIAERNRRSK